MIKTETRTLQLQFADATGGKVTYAVKNPSQDLNKAAVEAAAKTVIDSKVFETENGFIDTLKESRVVTHTVDVLE